MLGAGLLRRNTTDNFRIVVQGLLGVERSLFASESLNDDLGVAIQLEIASSRFVRIESNAGLTKST